MNMSAESVGQWVLCIRTRRLCQYINYNNRNNLPYQSITLPVFCFADHWELHPDELTLGEEIGSGQFGLVLEGQWKNKKVAVKKIREGCMSEDELREEARVMM